MRTTTRRSLLVAGAGALTVFAGCSGESDAPAGTDTDTEPQSTTDASPTSSTTAQPTPTERPPATTRPTTLAIEKPVFCTEQPTGYRDYTRQPDATYERDDVVWLYLEPSTTGTELAGNGERRFEYTLSMTVTGPDGERLGTVEDTVSKTVPEGSDLTTVFLSGSYTPPTTFAPGTHTLAVEVTDTIAGNTASRTLEFGVERDLKQAGGEFGITRFAFTDERAQAYREYDPNPTAEYAPSADVWYYYEIDGFAYEATEDKVVHRLDLHETLTGPEGDVWSDADIRLTRRFDPGTDLDTYWVTDSLSPRNSWTTGDYDLSFELTDGYTDETATTTYTFTVVE